MSPFAVIVIVVVLLTAGILGLKSMIGPKAAPSEKRMEAKKGGAEAEVRQIIAKVASHIVIKADEQPTVATIQDAELLRAENPNFYKDAQNGDRLLIWSDKAVLYSTSMDKLLAVLPVSLPVGTSTATTTAMDGEEAEKVTIEVRNGSTTPGLGRTMADKLKAAGLTVLPATDAKKKDYAKTMIYVRSVEIYAPKTLETIRRITGATDVVEAPADETPLKGDILVIVGANATP